MTGDFYCLSLDIAKTSDSIDHKIIKISFHKPRTTIELINLIKKLFSDFTVILKIGKEKGKINVACGVRQGDNLAPTLLIIVMQMVTEIIHNMFPKG